MGISGLLQALRDVMDYVSVEEFRGKTAAIDGYAWLHKGVYACSTELCLGKKTDRYIKYIMDKIDMLLKMGVIPYMVFDGDYLPMKAGKEEERAASRKKNLKRGVEYLKNGNSRAAHNCFVKAVDVTPEMAFEVIKRLRERNVQYIVAPYEADAQLAWLSQNGHVDVVISEDSDCIPFGCNKVLFKMDKAGNGLLYHAKNLSSCEKLDFLHWTNDMVLDMCILAGCDYLPSIRGMGVMKAHDLVAKYKTPERIFKALRFTGSMRVPPGYEKKFKEARLTFLHQRIFDPGAKVLTTLKPLPSNGIDTTQQTADALDYLGPSFDHVVAHGVAVGDVNPTTKRPFPKEQVEQSSSEQQEMLQELRDALEKAKGPATAAHARAFFARRQQSHKPKPSGKPHSGRVSCAVSQKSRATASRSVKRVVGTVIGGRNLASFALTHSKRVQSQEFTAPRSTSPADGTNLTTVAESSTTRHAVVIRHSSSMRSHLQRKRSAKQATCTSTVATESVTANSTQAMRCSKFFPAPRSPSDGAQNSLRRADSNLENLRTSPADSQERPFPVKKLATTTASYSQPADVGAVLEKFAFGCGDAGEQCVSVPSAIAPVRKRPRGVKGIKSKAPAARNPVESAMSWNAFQQMHRGRQVTTAEWRQYQRSQRGNNDTASGSVIFEESTEISKVSQSKRGSESCSTSTLFDQFLCSMSK
mgnify:CR=1 FL=1